MRLLRISWIAMAVLVFTAASASAYEITFANLSGPVAGATDEFTVEVRLDTQGESNINSFEIGVTFTGAYLEYDRPGSLTGGTPSPYPGYPNYILYGGSGRSASFMEPRVPTPGGFTWDPPFETIPGQQVNIGFIEVNLGGTSATATDLLLATLKFHATGTVPKDASIGLSLSSGGAGFILGGGTNVSDQVILGPDINIAPEPGAVAVSFAALLTLGGLRRYRRRSH